ncbi:MAG TPA: L-rhamnose mutarotase [Vicinamibacteria bacterium]|nr:L-rhamnose mutarotase [Vicinamibacteria bacterium]
MKRYVLTVDLKDDARLVAEYKAHHRAVWPEVQRSLRRVGVRAMDIYALGRRLTMVMDTDDGFDLAERFARHAASDPRCREWEELMRTYQEPPPGARPGEVWARMEPVFHLAAEDPP